MLIYLTVDSSLLDTKGFLGTDCGQTQRYKEDIKKTAPKNKRRQQGGGGLLSFIKKVAKNPVQKALESTVLKKSTCPAQQHIKKIKNIDTK